jgi:hypothetical protein
MELTPEERRRIYEEEREKLEGENITQHSLPKISNSAPFPPASQPKMSTQSATLWVLGSIGILFVAGLIFNASRETAPVIPQTLDSESGYTSPYRKPTLDAPIHTGETAAPLLLISSRMSRSYGYINATGEVKNSSTQPLKNVEAVAVFRTKDGTFVKTSSAIVKYNPILPGQISPFEVMDTDNPEIKSFEISFKELGGGTITHMVSGSSSKSTPGVVKDGTVTGFENTNIISSAENGDINVVKSLLKAGVSPNFSNGDGETALMAAARKGNSEMARLLLSAGADVNSQSKYGQTPLRAAEINKHYNLVEYFRRMGAKE